MDVNDRSPSAFISYARESDDHKEWVKKLAKRLREYRFIAYTGLEDGVGFDLSLSVAWTLSKQNVEWGVSIDDMRMPGSGGRISYSECKGKEHDSSRFVRTVCGTLMDEIRRRSQLPSKASGFTRSNE